MKLNSLTLLFLAGFTLGSNSFGMTSQLAQKNPVTIFSRDFHPSDYDLFFPNKFSQEETKPLQRKRPIGTEKPKQKTVLAKTPAKKDIITIPQKTLPKLTILEKVYFLKSSLQEEMLKVGISEAIVKLALENGVEKTHSDRAFTYSLNLNNNKQLHLLSNSNLKLFKFELLNKDDDNFLTRHSRVAGYLATPHFKERMIERLIPVSTISSAIKKGIVVPSKGKADKIFFIYPGPKNKFIQVVVAPKKGSLITVFENRNARITRITSDPEKHGLFIALQRELQLDTPDSKKQTKDTKKSIPVRRVIAAIDWKKIRAKMHADFQKEVEEERQEIEAEDEYFASKYDLQTDPLKNWTV